MGGHTSKQREAETAEMCTPAPAHHDDGEAANMCVPEGPGEHESDNPLLRTMSVLNSATEPARGVHEASEIPHALHALQHGHAPASDLAGMVGSGVTLAGGVLTYREGQELVARGGTTNTLDGRMMKAGGGTAIAGGTSGVLASSGALGEGLLATGAGVLGPLLGAGAAVIGTEASGDQYGARHQMFGKNAKGEDRGAFEEAWDLGKQDGDAWAKRTGSGFVGSVARGISTGVREAGAVGINGLLGVRGGVEGALDLPGEVLTGMYEGQREQDNARLRAGSTSGELPPANSIYDGPAGDAWTDGWDRVPR